MSSATIKLDRITPHWSEVQSHLHLGPIRDETHYDEMVRHANALIDAGAGEESHPLAELLYIVNELIADYDVEHFPLSDTDPAGILRFLMDQHGLRQSDLPEIGSRGVISEILSGKRRLNARQIAGLAERFNISENVFFQTGV